MFEVIFKSDIIKNAKNRAYKKSIKGKYVKSKTINKPSP